MTSAIRARKPLALLAAAAVVAAGLALSPTIATPAHASASSSAASKLLKKVNAYRVAHDVAAYKKNTFIAKNAQEVAAYIAKKKNVGAKAHPKTAIPTVASADDTKTYVSYVSGGKASGRLARLEKLYLTQGASAIGDDYYNYGSIGLVVTKDAIYSTIVIAHYDVGPFTQSTPKITGTAKVGATLTAKTATSPSGATYTYSWRYGSTVLGTGSSYIPVAADLGHTITLTTVASKDGYITTPAKKSAGVKILAGTIVSSKPVVTGTRTVGETLTATVDPWGPGTVALTYQWLRNGKVIKSATESSYLLAPADKGTVINVKVIGREAGFKATSVTTGSKTKTKAAPVTPAP